MKSSENNVLRIREGRRIRTKRGRWPHDPRKGEGEYEEELEEEEEDENVKRFVD